MGGARGDVPTYLLYVRCAYLPVVCQMWLPTCCVSDVATCDNWSSDDSAVSSMHSPSIEVFTEFLHYCYKQLRCLTAERSQ